MDGRALFIYDPGETGYRFNEHHPFNPLRLELTIDLLRRLDALPPAMVESPSPVEESRLCSVHTPAYVAAVRALSDPSPSQEWVSRSGTYGLDTEDTPYFPGMHEVTAAVVGGSVQAVDAVMSGRRDHALHLAGGLHHAFPGRGAGFCVYNDASVAIAHAREVYGARVLYIDTDVHHGDGVQWSFYSDPDVCTFSIHETGKYLFPGTGGVQERGEGTGFGTSVNLPMEPYTEDASWLECFEEVLQRTAEHFKPDLIISQHGCDAHAYDPLAHIHCSMEIYREMPRIIHDLAHRCCAGRWAALGGGGYDIWRVVPRAWSLLWLEMSAHPLIGELRQNAGLPLPASWIEAWRPTSTAPLPCTWLDPVHTWDPMPRRSEITAKNRQTKEIAMLYLG